MKLICTQPHNAERDKLAAELAGLRVDVKALKSERDETAERNKLRDQIEQLRREKATLTEDNARKVRETEHKTGLLRQKTDQDIANAVAFLASDLAGFITGAYVPVCGGGVMPTI